MRPTQLLVIAALLISFLSVSPARAQRMPATLYASANTGIGMNPTPAAPVATEKIVLAGKITNPAGPLPGAVVTLTGSKQITVTNADGEFEFEVPASAGALQAVVTYAGYADETMTLNTSADESTVSLTNARVIVVSRKQQLKKYLKTAQKQVKRELKQVRK